MDEQRLEMFFSSLGGKLQIYREEKRRWDPFLSTDFNVVSEFIRPNENRLSYIIACLLDANGSHGQGDKFLDVFIRRLFEKKRPGRIAELSGKQPQVRREDPTYYNDENQRRRIDITLDFKDVGIGIENKPWADEGDGQLADYYSHLKRKYKNKEFCLVFITPDGRKPKSIKKTKGLIEEGKLYCLSYRSDILEWLEECWQLCESDRFRWFLHDFRKYIRDEFLLLRRTKMPTNERETKIIMEHVKDNENLGVALDIIYTKIREQIITTFLKKLQDFICGKLNISPWDWETGLRDKPYEAKYLGFGVRRKFDVLNNKPVYIILQTETKALSNLVIGVCSDDTEPIALMQCLSSKLDVKLGKGTSSKYWLWRESLKSSDPDWDYTDWNNKDTLIKMYTKTDCVVEAIGNRLLEIIEVAKPVIEKWGKQNPATL